MAPRTRGKPRKERVPPTMSNNGQQVPQRGYWISEEVRDAIVQYLVQRPMQEVEGGVGALRAAVSCPPPFEGMLDEVDGPNDDDDLPAPNPKRAEQEDSAPAG